MTGRPACSPEFSTASCRLQPKMGRECRLAEEGEPFNPAGPWGLASLPRDAVVGHWRTRGTQDAAPHLSPTSLTAHASARSQTSKNVKHVDARGGGRGRDGYRGAGLGASFPAATP